MFQVPKSIGSRPWVWLSAIALTCGVLLYALSDLLGGRTRISISELNSDKSLSSQGWLRDMKVSCRGPSSRLLDISPVDRVQDRVLQGAHPLPYAGSYRELGLKHTWSTAAERYGTYGIGNESDIDWSLVDWADLQNECLDRNLEPHIRASITPIAPSRKLRFPSRREEPHLFSSRVPPRPKVTSGRTAIIVRGWSTFEFKHEDYVGLRALITETSLRYHGQYTVYFLVDVKGDRNVLQNAKQYEEVLNTIPAEFRNMTVLFDQHNVLRTWYPKAHEYRPEWQMEQARQILPHVFDEFDHYWTIELDLRFTGNAGNMINALETFARKEPRKQARERSSYFFTRVYGTYRKLTSLVNDTLNGGSGFWNGVPIPDVEPVGPMPPSERPEDDDFKWGVGEEADLIMLSSTFNVTLAPEWHYKQWIFEFSQGTDTPRIASAPAVSRCSWNLLNQIHQAQVWQGLRLPSEATPASFALYHNFKISRPPFPIYGEFSGEYSDTDIDIFLNGGPPSKEHGGMAWGRNAYGSSFSQDDPVKDLGPTWRWNPGYPGHLFEVWMRGDAEAADKLPSLVTDDGKVLMPNLILHPVKSNPEPPRNPQPP